MKTRTERRPAHNVVVRLALVVVMGSVFATGAARAAPAKLPRSLAAEVASARRLDPSAFVNVSAIVSRAPSAHAKARGQRASVAQQLARLGPAATLPMLEQLAAEPPVAVRRDLIEALGLLADARSIPTLGGIVGDETEEAETTRTAAEALARIGTDVAAARLLATLNGASGEHARALVLGMGELRTRRVTEAIASRARSGDAAMARAAARALGRAGNAWVWKTLRDHGEEQAIRETAARTLVALFVAHEGEARQAASNALMVVDAPLTPSLIAEARAGASPAVRAALDDLGARLANNPAR